MSRPMYFVQHCPVCGRGLQVRLELLGKQVSCRHCGGAFVARDPAMGMREPNAGAGDLVSRANDLLSSADNPKHRPR